MSEYCDARPGARVGFIRKKRPDGTTYSVPAVVGGERCTEYYVVSWFTDGHRVQRCIAHMRWAPSASPGP